MSFGSTVTIYLKNTSETSIQGSIYIIMTGECFRTVGVSSDVVKRVNAQTNLGGNIEAERLRYVLDFIFHSCE